MKAQVSTEFLTMFMLLAIFATVVFYINYERRVETSEFRIRSDASRISDLIENEINIAIEQGDGYERTFFIPYKIADLDYKIYVYSDGSLGITWDNEYYLRKLLTANITNGTSPPPNNFEISTGYNRVKNSKGGIEILAV